MILYSKSFIFTSREEPKAAECVSHKLLLKGCFLYMFSAGIYSYLPLGLRVLSKVSNIIRKHMQRHGAQELLMTALQPLEIWEKTGRDKALQDVMIKFKDRKNRLLCLGPTHEEEVTEIIRRFVSSYKQLPLILYQIQAKFRDEPRPRFGLLRSCEFIMKDAYSFDRDEEGLSQNYEKMREAYQDIFRDCGLNYVMTEAESGAMGGDVSHEFMVRAPIGEDLLYRCSGCNKYFKKPGQCSDCGVVLEEEKMIEVGHIFKLGTKYSQSQEAYFLDNDGERKPMIMGCYGIGVSRLLPAIVETNYDREGIIWPRNVSPFDISLIILDEELRSDALAGAQMLEKQGLEVLVDDRLLAAGVKFNDTCLIGNPYIAIMGKNYKNSRKIDLEIRKTKDKFSFSLEELANFLKKEYAG